MVSGHNMRKKVPKVTVLMPVYNGENYLREAIHSILIQTFTDFEFLIINDGSTDRSVEIIESFADSRLILINNEKKLKLIETLNRGLKRAQGEYLARMDCDDISSLERLERQVAFMDAHPDVGVLGTGFQLIDSEGKMINNPVHFPSMHKILQWCLNFFSPIVHPSVMMRRKVVLEAGGYSREFIHAEDYELWCRLSRLTRLDNLQDALLSLRKHETNITGAHLEEHLKNAKKIRQLMISESINEYVSIELVDKLSNQKCNSVKDALQVSRLMYKLYHAHVRKNKLSWHEKRLIRKDAGKRLFNIVRPFVKDVHTWGFFLLSIFVNPNILLQSAKTLINNLFAKPTSSYGNGA
ncbi:MAG: glycosyltransferase [Deltaproteobacteria bacterium]|nr:glycosyltransferase [Deltaproteobacteria bacterium]